MTVNNLRAGETKAFQLTIRPTTPDDTTFKFSFNSGSVTKTKPAVAAPKKVAEDNVPAAAKKAARATPKPAKEIQKSAARENDTNTKARRLVKLRHASVPFGEITSNKSLTNKGAFTDAAATYVVENSKGDFLFLNDGNQKGWVLRSSTTSVDGGETKTAATQAVKSSPRYASVQNLIKTFEAKGFRPSVSWKKSRVEPGWVGIWHVFNYSKDRNWLPTEQSIELANETNFQLYGPTAHQVHKVIIEAEVYDLQHASVTLDNAVECLRLVGAPPSVLAAVKARRSIRHRGWETKYRGRREGGFDIECTGKAEGLLPTN